MLKLPGIGVGEQCRRVRGDERPRAARCSIWIRISSSISSDVMVLPLLKTGSGCFSLGRSDVSGTMVILPSNGFAPSARPGSRSLGTTRPTR